MSNLVLHELLHLPDSVQIRCVVQREEDRLTDQFMVIVEGDGLPEKCKWFEGCYPTRVDVVHERQRDTKFVGFR